MDHTIRVIDSTPRRWLVRLAVLSWVAALALAAMGVAYGAAPYDHSFTSNVDSLPLDGGEKVWDNATAPAKKNGLLLDNCDGFRCRVRNFRGDAVTLTRTAKPQAGRADMPMLAYFEGQDCYNGIVVNSVDQMIHSPRIMGMVHCGIDWRYGASACDRGQVYGCGDFAGITRKAAADVEISGTEFSDSRKGLVLLGADGQDSGIYSERCWEHNILVGAKTNLSNVSLKIKEFTTDQKDWTPTAIEFARRPDPELGQLDASHSKYLGGSISLEAHNTTKRMTGIHINRAHMVRIADVDIAGPPNAIAFLAEGDKDQGIDGVRASITVTGGARIILRYLGVNCSFRFYYHNGAFNLELPDDWHETTHVYVNDAEEVPVKRRAA